MRKLAIALAAAAALVAPPANAAHPVTRGPRLRFGGDLFVVSRSGESVSRFPGGHGASYPVWSPNGKLIAFQTQIGDRDKIEVWTAGGRFVHRFDAGEATGSQPSFSPDSQTIAFTYAYYNQARDSDDGLLVTASVTGGHRRVLTDIATERPAWSPDGSTLYYVRDDIVGTFPEPNPIETSIWRVARDGSGAHRVVADTLPVSPAVSPYDARVLAWRAAGRRQRIWTAGPDGDDQRALATGFFDGALMWGPRGRAAAGLQAIGRQRRLMLFELGGESRPLATAVNTDPWAWSPDGGRIAWVDGERVRTVRPDGSDPKVLFRFRLGRGTKVRFPNCADVVWAPGGSRFLVSCALDEID